VLDRTVLGRCMQRHRHQEFIRFLNAIEAAVPAGKIVHAGLWPPKFVFRRCIGQRALTLSRSDPERRVLRVP
jgi:hypothetical protein